MPSANLCHAACFVHPTRFVQAEAARILAERQLADAVKQARERTFELERLRTKLRSVLDLGVWDTRPPVVAARALIDAADRAADALRAAMASGDVSALRDALLDAKKHDVDADLFKRAKQASKQRLVVHDMNVLHRLDFFEAGNMWGDWTLMPEPDQCLDVSTLRRSTVGSGLGASGVRLAAAGPAGGRRPTRLRAHGAARPAGPWAGRQSMVY